MAEASKIHYGLEGLHIFFKTGENTWGEPQEVPGLVGFNSTAQTNSTKFSADNITYFVVTGDEGDEADLETAGIPKEIIAKMLGWVIDDKGVLVRISNGNPTEFAMSFQVEGDQANRRKVYYNCKAAVPDVTHSTKGESIDVQTETLKLSITAVDIDGRKCISAIVDENDDAEAYASFFTGVYKPTVVSA